MKVKLGQLRQVIRECLTEAARPTVVVGTISKADVSKWDEVAKQLRVKSDIRFEPLGPDTVTVTYKGYGTEGQAMKRAGVLGRKMQKLVDKMAGSEKPVDDQRVYDLLKFAFTSTIAPEDVQYIRYMPMKNAVRMTDYDGMLGNMDAGVGMDDLSRYGLTPRQLGDWLAAHGARPMKQQRRARPAPSIYD